MALRLLCLLLICATISFLFINNGTASKSSNIKADLIFDEDRHVYIGAWVGGFWESKTRTLDVEKLSEFENLVAKKVAIANIFSGWEYLKEPKLVEKLNSMNQEGWVPMISSNPSNNSDCPKVDKSFYKNVADGHCDKLLSEIGLNLKSYNKPVFLRFAWEMNHPDMYWSIKSFQSTSQDFNNAWRRFHKIVEQSGADNVIWVLSFNTSNSNSVPYIELFPGDQYVDWVAIDGYNWGTSQEWSGWTSFDGVFRKSYDELTSITSKPIMLSEVNSSSDGGDKAKWLDDMLSTQIPNNYKQVEAIVFFNESKIGNENVDWRIETSQENLGAVRASLKNSLYKSYYP